MSGSENDRHELRSRGSESRRRNNQNPPRPRPNRHEQKQRRYEGNSHVIMVPSAKVGLIIGKGGWKIRALKNKSNAEIQTGASNGYETAITLYGSSEAVARAKELINDLTKERGGARQAEQDQGRDEASGGTDVSDTKRFEGKDASGAVGVNWQKLTSQCEQLQKERSNNFPLVVKDFYKEDAKVASMPAAVAAQWRRANYDSQVKRLFDEKPGLRPIPNPVLTFEQAFQHYPEILREIRKQGFQAPTPIQSQAWPILLRGEDMIGIAGTGAGKTLAFLLPALIHIEGQPTPRDERKAPTVLILAPTRKVVLQIDKEVSKYEHRGIKSVCLYGGGDRKEQIQGVDIVIATPGRLSEFVRARLVTPINFSYIVLDEADIMLDMGFELLIKISLFNVKPSRQTVMTSATWPSCVRHLAELYMTDPIQVKVCSLDLAAVTQKFMFTDEDKKNEMLYDFLTNLEPNNKVVVFCIKKSTVAHIFTELCAKGVRCHALHRGESDCEEALEDTVDGKVNIVIATDVASRSVDIKGVTHVVNWDFPKHIKEYVHRVGRIDCAGKTGIALSFVTRSDWAHAGELVKIMKEAKQEVPKELEQMADEFEAMKLQKGGKGCRGKGEGPAVD